MLLLSRIFSALVLLIHLYIFSIETFLYRARGVQVFAIAPEHIDLLERSFMNQGFYNGFLAAALLLGFILPKPLGKAFTAYGLGCVAVAGIVGAATVKIDILFVQTVPATLGLIFLMLAHRGEKAV